MDKIRDQFPILTQKVHGKPLIYFDNGASAQKPKAVIDAVNQYYSTYHSNVHRGVHYLSQLATEAFEKTRDKMQGFIHAQHRHEVIFTKGTTDGINLVANAFREKYLKAGDEVLISAMEHHANIIPWQLACEKTGAVLKVIPINQQGELMLEEFERLLSSKTKIVAISHVSNTLGTINPIEKIIAKAHAQNTPVLIDGAQAIQHMRVDVQALDCDFYVFSGHKLFAPSGTGILYAKEKWLNDMPVYQSGGDMIKTVTFEKTTFNELPHKFEAGTPNIEGFIGLGAAIDFLATLNRSELEKHETSLLTYATQKLLEIEGLRIIGTAAQKISVISFLVGNIHPYDIGTLLDQMGIAVRTGHHCTQPLMDFYQIPGTVRASFAFYNTIKEVDLFVEALKKAVKMLG
jgi:cysteine desulfurase/selenocysteine lyase